MSVIYLRNSTTTPLDAGIGRLMTSLLLEDPRTSSGLLADGRRIGLLLEESRREVGRWCGASPEEIIFTSSGTESCNLALKGLSMARWREGLTSGRILVAATEHTAVLYPARTLGRLGFEIMEIPVGRDGLVDPGIVARMMGTATFLVSVAGVTSETGTIQPIEEIARVVHERGALLHSDSCLAAAGGGIDVRALGVDLASFSAHKLGGPRGIGALYVRNGIRLAPQIEGGLGESGRRGGTENIAGIAGFAAAVRGREADLVSRAGTLGEMTTRLEAALLGLPGITLNGPREGRLPGMINVAVDGLDGEAMLLKLGSCGIAASSGSSCLSEIGKPSHVLTAMGLPAAAARGSLLFSIGLQNTPEEIDQVIALFPGIVETLRSLSPSRGA